MGAGLVNNICPECGRDNDGFDWYTDDDGFEMCGDCYDTVQGRWIPLEEWKRRAFADGELFVVDFPEDIEL